ncbi:O-antigen ligase family protein [Micromonospora sp. CPCC 206060]|uniref:O-antigen ligase family protein n=1 Tax=Micromonospora sp. CPCC 206060 TaxID=3122406 RepID=UPI002FF01073
MTPDHGRATTTVIDRPAPHTPPPARRPGIPRALLHAAAGTVGTRIAVLVTSLVTGVITARLLGPHDRGTVAVVLAGASVYAALGAAGLETANLRFAGRSPADHQQAVWRSLWYVATAGLGMAAAWGLAGALLGPVARFGLDGMSFGLTLALGPVVLLSALLGSAEIGRSRAMTYNATMIGGLLVYSALLGAVAVLDRASPATVVGAYLGGQLAALTALLVRARPIGPLPTEPGAGSAYRSFARRAYLPNLAQFAMGRSQIPTIQLLAGAGAVGIYSVAVPFAEILLILPVALSLILVPAVANGSADWTTVARLVSRTVLATAAAAVALAAGAPIVFPLLFGTEFSGAVPVLWALLPGLAILAVGRTAQSYLTAIDRPAPTTLAAVAATAGGLLAMLVLIPRFDAVGAGLAVSIAYLVYSTVVGQAFLAARPRRPVRHQRSRGRRRRPRRAWRPPTAGTRSVLVVTIVGVVGTVTGLLSTRTGTTLALVAAAIILVGAVIAPTFGLYCLAVAVPATQLPTEWAPEVMPLLLLVLCCLVGTVLRRRLVTRSRYAVLAVGALIILLAYGPVVAGKSGGPIWSVVVLGIMLVSLPLVSGPGPAAQRTLLLFACAAVAVGGVHAVLGMIGVHNLVYEDPDLSETFSRLNHNAWGPMLVLAVAVLLARAGVAVGLRSRALYAIGIAVLVAGIGFSYSRSSYLGTLAVVVCFALRRRLWAFLTTALLVVGVLWIARVSVVPESISDRVAGTAGADGLDGSSTVRLDLWLSALRMAGDHPLFGVGYLSFHDRLPEYFVPSVTGIGPDVDLPLLVHPHNTYLAVLVELGLVGVLLVGGLLVGPVRQALGRLRANSDWLAENLLLALAGTAVCSFFGEPVLTLPVLVPIVLALSTVTRRPT